jgi:hypothetical protein
LQAVVASGVCRRQLLAQLLILLLKLAEAPLKAADFSPASENHSVLPLTVMTRGDTQNYESHDRFPLPQPFSREWRRAFRESRARLSDMQWLMVVVAW